MESVKPKKLKPGDTIGIVAPSSWIYEERLQQSADNLRSFGYKVVLHPHASLKTNVSAGSVEDRISSLYDIFSNPEIGAVFTATGGVRGVQLLDKIDYDLIRKNPKIFCGYSDTTFLFGAMQQNSGISGIHGISLVGFHPERDHTDQKNMLSFLSGNTQGDLLDAGKNVATLFPGEASGELFGGNFSLLIQLMAIGDKFMPSLKGKILMIEDVGEEIRQIDRMLCVLKQSGALDQIAGLIIGHMTDIRDGGDNYKYECSVNDLVTEYLQDKGIPVIYGAPFGHEAPNSPFPIGIKAQLVAPKNDRPTLKLLESPFSDA